ncbi:MAG: hypothetical protein RIC35_23060 [Marinoscillum sp.]
MSKGRTIKFIISFWILSGIVLLIQFFTALELEYRPANYFLTLSTITFVPLVLWLKKRTFERRILTIVTLAFAVFRLTAFYINYDGGGSWRTQTILFEHQTNSLRTVEYQMQDKGARGYNRRIVKRTKVLPLLSWNVLTKTDDLSETDWKKVNLEVNELGLKSP